MRVAPCHIERFFRNVARRDARARLTRNDDGDTAAARAEIEHRAFFVYDFERLVDELFRFGTGAEDVAVDVYLVAVKIRVAYDLPKRLSRLPAPRHLLEQFDLGMPDIGEAIEFGALFARDVTDHPIHVRLVFHHALELFAHVRIKLVGVERKLGKVRIRVHRHHRGESGDRHFDHGIVRLARGQLLHELPGEFQRADEGVVEFRQKFQDLIAYAHYRQHKQKPPA